MIFNHWLHYHPDASIRATLPATRRKSYRMFSQSLPAQLIRTALLLVITLAGVHAYQPLLDSFARFAVTAGCHMSLADPSVQAGVGEQPELRKPAQ